MVKICGEHSLNIAVEVILLAILSLAGGAGAVPVEEWNKTFGETAAYSVQQTSEGGYILAGSTFIYKEGGAATLIKTDSNGNLLWSKTFGVGDENSARDVKQTSDSGYILLGYGIGKASWLIKTDSNGNQQWSKMFGGNAKSVRQTFDGGYIFAGSSSRTAGGYALFYAFLIKTDASGNEQWNKPFGGIIGDVSVQQTSDGGYILAGEKQYGAKSDAWLLKTDADGNQQWNKTFGGTEFDHAFSVQQTSDGGYILAGETGEYPGDAWLIKTDVNGNQEWSKTFGGTEARSVQQTSDGGYVLAGWSLIGGGPDRNAWLIKTDTNGNQQWKKTFEGSQQDEFFSVQQTSDGGYILAGGTSSYGVPGSPNIWLVKVAEKSTDTTPPSITNVPPSTPKPTTTSTSITESNNIVEAANQYAKLFSAEFWGNEAQSRADAYLKSYTDPLSVALKAAKDILTSVLGASKMNSAAGILDDLSKSYSAVSAAGNQGLLAGMDVKAKGIGGNTLSGEFTTLANLLKENKDPKQQLVVVSNKIELYRDMLKNPDKYDASGAKEWSETVKTFLTNKNILLSMFDSAQEFIDALKINYGMEVTQTNAPPSQSSKRIPGFEAFYALIFIPTIAIKMKTRNRR